jgi:hypothetical protein
MRLPYTLALSRLCFLSNDAKLVRGAVFGLPTYRLPAWRSNSIKEGVRWNG